jgi:hypothetical protein
MNNIDKQFATRLGIAALAPFVFLMLLCWLVPLDVAAFFVEAQLVYGVAILGFLGGLHWGLSFIAKERSAQDLKRDLIWGVVPTIVAWFSLAYISGAAFLVQMIAFIFSYQYDKRMYQRFDVPPWFVELRYRLTCVVVSTQVLMFVTFTVRSFT